LTRKNAFILLLFTVFLLLILRYLISQNLSDLPRALQLTYYAAIPFAGGLTVFCIFSLIGALSSSANLAVSRIARKISEDPAGNFLFGFLVTAYLILIRPNLAANLSFLPQLEWIAVGLAVYSIYAMTGLSNEEFTVSSDEHLNWKKHVEEVARETGRDLKRVTSTIEHFVEDGTKEELLIYLTLHLQRLGSSEENIFQKLSPLINYQEPKRNKISLLFSFPQTERKRVIENKKERENLLRMLFEKI
jgi:hypothetical protein